MQYWYATLQQSLVTVVSFTEICYDPQGEVLVNYDLTNSSHHRNTCCCCCCLSMSNHGINFMEIWCIFKFSLRIYWQVPYDRPNCQLSLKWYFIFLHWQLCKLSCFYPRNWWIDVLNAHTLQLKSPYILIEDHLKFCVLPWHCPWKLLSAFHSFSMQFTWLWSKT